MSPPIVGDPNTYFFTEIKVGRLPMDLSGYRLSEFTYKKHTPVTFVIDCEDLRHDQRIDFIDRLCTRCPSLANEPEKKNKEPPLIVAMNYPEEASGEYRGRSSQQTKKIATTLLNHRAKYNEQSPHFDTLLIECVRRKKLEILKLLLEKDDLQLTDISDGKRKKNALHQAVEIHCMDAAKMLLDKASERGCLDELISAKSSPNDLTPLKTNRTCDTREFHSTLSKYIDELKQNPMGPQTGNPSENDEPAANHDGHNIQEPFENVAVNTFIN